MKYHKSRHTRAFSSRGGVFPFASHLNGRGTSACPGYMHYNSLREKRVLRTITKPQQAVNPQSNLRKVACARSSSVDSPFSIHDHIQLYPLHLTFVKRNKVYSSILRTNISPKLTSILASIKYHSIPSLHCFEISTSRNMNIYEKFVVQVLFQHNLKLI